jgi:hypothetical protein
VVPGPSVADVAEETSWRERAEGAEQRLAAAEARIEELTGQVAVLARMLFGRSSEKASAGTGGGGPSHAAHPGDQSTAGEDAGAQSKPKLGSMARAWLNAWGALLLIGVILIGIVLPLVLQFRSHRGRFLGDLATPAGSVLALVGGFIFRIVIVLSAQGIRA